MNVSELKSRLLAAGCNERNICIGDAGTKSDVDCLENINGVWHVYYTERGQRSEPIFSTRSEEEAAEFYYDRQMRSPHAHMICFYKDEEKAAQLQTTLDDAHIAWWRNDIPAYRSADDPRFRLYVFGKDIFRVRALFSELPLTDTDMS